MKKLLFLFLASFAYLLTGAQNVGIGTATPEPTAALDVSSTSKGFLPPRMSFAERAAITNPAEGLIVYLLDRKKMTYYNGSEWRTFDGNASTSEFAIGDFYQGGIVGYILVSGDPGYDPLIPHGLLVASSDQSTSIQWDDNNTNIGVGTPRTFGTGLTNTANIINAQMSLNYAARLCWDLNLNGYTDWYLPSTNELQKIYPNRVLIGGFAPTSYWTSSDVGFSNFADTWNFSSGAQGGDYKYNFHRVRAIRSF